MPEPISRPSPKAAPVEPAERLDQLQPHLLLAGVAEVDAPLGVVFVGGGVVVAGVDVLDVLGRGGGGGRHRRGTLRGTAQSHGVAGRAIASLRPWRGAEYLQLNQPDGVPPLPLTGERTLPDVPEENYWYRRHLVVYEWIAARVAGLRVVDMACGEGYGSNVLAGAARPRSSASTPTPRPTSTPACATCAPTCASSATWSRASPSPATPSSSCRRSSTSRTPARSSSTSSRCWRPGGVAYVSTPNLLTLAPPGAEKSDNPWHVHEYRAAEFRRLCEDHFAAGRAARPLPRPQAARPRAGDQARLGLASTSASGLTKPFYDRFTPAIAASDFALQEREPRRGAGLPRRLPCLRSGLRERRRPGDRPALATCPTSRASGPTRSARSGCSTR